MTPSTSHPFNHPLMPYPDRQIRLLKILDPGRGQSLSFELATFTVTVRSLSARQIKAVFACPPYVALSYTWGSARDTSSILINGCSAEITLNCLLALEQATRYCNKPTQWYWIDSICIDQQNLTEKAQQVRYMGQIYFNASIVLACVGAEADESPFLFRTLHQIEDQMIFLDESDEGFYEENCEEVLRDAFSAPLGDCMVIDKFLKALISLGCRPYWTRLWILQELYLAASVIVLCGSSWASMKSINRFYDMAFLKLAYTRLQIPVPKTEHPITRILRHGHDTDSEIMLSYLLEVFEDWKCKDPRDHIYGLLALVHWPAGMEPLEPDYTTDCKQLAEKAFTYIVADHQNESKRYQLKLENTLHRVLGLVSHDKRTEWELYMGTPYPGADS